MAGPESSRGWADAERDAFWTYVRGRMGEARLTQAEVARAVGFDRSVLARRLGGQIKDRPTAAMVDHLVSVLRLDETAKQYLRQLAGYAEQGAVQASPTADASVAPSSPPGVARRGLRSRLAVGLVVSSCLLLVMIVAAALMRSFDLVDVLREQAAVARDGTVAGWVLFKDAPSTRPSSAWVTIWYIDPRHGWLARSVEIHDRANVPGCSRYLERAGVGAMTGGCYEFADIPRESKLQVRVHYASGLIRDYYADPGGRASLFWVDVTHETLRGSKLPRMVLAVEKGAWKCCSRLRIVAERASYGGNRAIQGLFPWESAATSEPPRGFSTASRRTQR